MCEISFIHLFWKASFIALIMSCETPVTYTYTVTDYSEAMITCCSIHTTTQAQDTAKEFVRSTRKFGINLPLIDYNWTMHFDVLIQVQDMLKQAHLRSKLPYMETFTGKLKVEYKGGGRGGRERGVKREKCGRHREEEGVREGRREVEENSVLLK